MAKKAKKTKSVSKSHPFADDHTFLIIVGGGFVIILLMLITVSRSIISDRFNGSENSMSTSKVVADENTVTISDDMIVPETLTVPAGTQVTWVNGDEDEQMITSYNGTFDSKELKNGEKSTYMFTTPGTYTYTVGEMTGSVVVE